MFTRTLAMLSMLILCFSASSQISLLKTNGNIGLGLVDPEYQIHFETDEIFVENQSGEPIMKLGFGNSIFIGPNTGLSDNGTNNKNIGIGYMALQNNTNTTHNVAIGSETMLTKTGGNNNVALGYRALRGNASGAQNVSIGGSSSENFDGLRNVSVGYNAGRRSSDGSDLVTSNRSVYIGYNTKSLNTSSADEVVIGSNAIGHGNNTITFGNTDVTDNFFTGTLNLQDLKLTAQNASSLNYDSNSSNSTRLIMRDKENQEYGSILGNGNGNNFGILDGDGNWSYRAFKDGYTELRIDNNTVLRLESTGELKLPNYIGGNHTGTVDSYLAVDAAGNVIKTTSVPPQSQAFKSHTTKELKEQLSNLSAKLNQAFEELEKLKNDSHMDHSQAIALELIETEDLPVLLQNIPNPTDQNTVIHYYIPDNTIDASLEFFSISGQLLRSVNLEKSGKGSLNVDISNIPSGNYKYSLVVDGQIIDTKSMGVIK